MYRPMLLTICIDFRFYISKYSSIKIKLDKTRNAETTTDEQNISILSSPMTGNKNPVFSLTITTSCKRTRVSE